MEDSNKIWGNIEKKNPNSVKVVKNNRFALKTGSKLEWKSWLETILKEIQFKVFTVLLRPEVCNINDIVTSDIVSLSEEKDIKNYNALKSSVWGIFNRIQFIFNTNSNKKKTKHI